jgi:endoglycosylceramidase
MRKVATYFVLFQFFLFLYFPFPGVAKASHSKMVRIPGSFPEIGYDALEHGEKEASSPVLTWTPRGPVDREGRLVCLRGVNVAGNAKLPPFIPFEDPSWFDLLSSWGFDMIRLTVFWEAIEPEVGVYDRAYLEKVEFLVREAAKRRIYVLVDMHQDLYSRFLGGDGAPYWAFPPEVGPSHNNGFGGQFWGLAYFLSSDVRKCFTHFWRSQELQEHYIGALVQVAERVSDVPFVLGYDIMNEPSAGDIPNGEGEFEKGYLLPFYRRAAEALRRVHPGATVFIEPHMPDMYTSKMTGPGITNAVFAPHLYNPVSNMLLIYVPDFALFWIFLELLKAKASGLGLPLFIGEFGAHWGTRPEGSRNRSVDNALRLFENNFLGCAYWDFSVQDVDAWNGEDFSLLDREGRPRGLEVNVRPYAVRLKGEPLSQGFDLSSRTYRLAFRSDPGGPPTEIFVPREVHYRGGFRVEVSDGKWSFRRKEGILRYVPSRKGEHVVTIRPAS